MMNVENIQTKQITQPTHYSSLVQVLGELAELYENLLTVLQTEKSYLIHAEIEKLVENNRAKEALLYKIRYMDRRRQKIASEFAISLGLPPEELRLLEIAKKLKGNEAENLRSIHKTLNMQVERAVDFNRENEGYAHSALKTLDGAIKDIQQSVTVKPTYGNKGQMAGSHESNAGNFVSKEA